MQCIANTLGRIRVLEGIRLVKIFISDLESSPVGQPRMPNNLPLDRESKLQKAQHSESTVLLSETRRFIVPLTPGM